MKRHALPTRIWHWTNAVAFTVLFMSGLNISNAHPYLYWGNYGFQPSEAWLSVIRFPAWATIPQRYDLAEARDWHNLAVWFFALALLGMWIASLLNRHFRRDLATSLRDWSPKAWKAVFAEHWRGYTDRVAKYNALQKIAYGMVLGVLLPMMVFTGLAMSPGIEPAAPWLVEILGGRQSARSLHFIIAWLLFGFVVGHVALAFAPGQRAELRAMISGEAEEQSRYGRH